MVTRPGGAREARWTGKVALVEEHLADPLRWRRPRMVFEVAAVSAPTGRGDDHIQPLSGSLAEHLQRHGVNAYSATLFRDAIGVGDQILNYASDHGVDLIVLGVYSQSRRGGQLSLGEVGRHLLRCMTVPTLMSH
jgi:nucleotide-binding universal stress UspA family protein